MKLKGIKYETIEVKRNSEWKKKLRDMTGTFMVPVIADGNTIMNESDDIIKYLKENYCG